MYYIIRRCDIQISPKNKNVFGAIIEIKYLNYRTTDARLKATAKTALNQINKKEYINELKERNAKPLIIYGIAFNKNSVELISEKVE